MNFLQLTEKSVWEQPVVPTYSSQPSPIAHLVRHRDPSPAASILAVVSFMTLSMAMVFLTAHLDLFGSSKPQSPVHHIRVVHVQQ